MKTEAGRTVKRPSPAALRTSFKAALTFFLKR